MNGEQCQEAAGVVKSEVVSLCCVDRRIVHGGDLNSDKCCREWSS